MKPARAQSPRGSRVQRARGATVARVREPEQPIRVVLEYAAEDDDRATARLVELLSQILDKPVGV